MKQRDYCIVLGRKSGESATKPDFTKQGVSNAFKMFYYGYREEYDFIRVGNQRTGEMVTSWPDDPRALMTCEQFLKVANNENSEVA
jgi:hypothetical protein